MQNLYWMRTVMMKNTTPSTAMANRFFPTMSHSRGERNRFSPETGHSQHLDEFSSFPPTVLTHLHPARNIQKTLCRVFTESLEGVGHRLVLHHINESSPETEVREDEEDVLQDVVDSSDLL